MTNPFRKPKNHVQLLQLIHTPVHAGTRVFKGTSRLLSAVAITLVSMGAEANLIDLNSLIGGQSFVVDYGRMQLLIDCEKRSAIMFKYRVGADNGDIKRVDEFAHDPAVPRRCQQSSTWSYGGGYDRGHLVPQNHLDDSLKAMVQSNYMTNILPQKAALNRGAWLATEEMIECHRDDQPITVLGGALWLAEGKEFKRHGVVAPSHFWKVMLKDSGESIAFLFPNTNKPKDKVVADYIVSIEDIESLAGKKLTSNRKMSGQKSHAPWVRDKYCDKG